ncbi:lipase family protein [Rhodococcus sp. NPDC058521]|uniref:lipase family protein n=1 Tax=Rhodococcus sp. NPDC058521 TaxID=3346536 RepID=UPI00365BEB74
MIDGMVPPPESSPAGVVRAPVAQLPPGRARDAGLGDLYASVVPSDVGDPFFDLYPPGLAEQAPGAVLDRRDVTATSAPFVGAPVERVEQVKFRSEDAAGNPSFGTASLIVPATEWTGEGDRPVVVNNVPIDSLGRVCTPGYTMAHGVSITTNPTDYIPPITLLAAQRGYAVLVPDHEGPRMAYAEPTTAGHVVLDSLRAIRSMDEGFDDSPIVMTGYSGGAIATNGAAKLIDSYAPDLKGAIRGAALGGTPIDYEVLVRSMTGGLLNLGKGLFVAAGLGVARENPDIFTKVNNPALRIAPAFRDLCVIPMAMLGGLPVPIELLSNMGDPFNSEFAHEMYSKTGMKGIAYGTPMYVYNGAQEFWVPSEMATDLYAEQCSLGTPAVLRLPAGEHLIAALSGLPETWDWIDQRLRGVLAPDECG